MNIIQVKDRDFPPEIYTAAWSFLEREYESLKAVCRKYSRRQPELVDELMSDVVTVRMPHVMSTYIPGGRASLRTHVFSNIKWYLYKYVNAMDQHHARYGGQLVDAQSGAEYYGETVTTVTEAQDEVQYLLSQLSPYDRSLVSLYHLCHVSFHELADILGVGYGTARTHYKAAVRRAREKLSEQAWSRALERMELLEVCSTSSAPCASSRVESRASA